MVKTFTILLKMPRKLLIFYNIYKRERERERERKRKREREKVIEKEDTKS